MLSRSAIQLLNAPLVRVARPTPIARTAIIASMTWIRLLSKKRREPTSPDQWRSGPEPSQPSKAKAANPQTSPQPPSQTPKHIDETLSKQPPSESQETPQMTLEQLPDLTQGIPSTLEYEAAAKDPNALTTTEQAEGGGRRKGELPASAYISSSERRRNRLARWLYLFMLGSGVVSIVYLGRDWESEAEVAKHPEAPNGLSLGNWWRRAKIRSTEWLTYYQEPAFEKLLPDPDPSFERPYTLVLSLEDLLIHSEWSRDRGWRMAKRPGLDYFLRYLSQYYELVLFTSVPFAMGEPAIRKLDPYHFVMWPLFREATKYIDGEWVKDLSYLNRDLSKVIIIDTNQKHVSAQPENAIVLKKWSGETRDSGLVALIPFLEFIHTVQFPDVRKVLKSFEGKDIPTEFARREAIARKEFQKELEVKKKSVHHDTAPSGLGFIGGLLGMKPSSMSMMQVPEGEENPQEAFAKGKMLQDIARERGQRNYMMLEQQIKEHGEKWLKEEQEMMEKAQKEAMAGMKSSFSSWFAGPPRKDLVELKKS